MIDRIITVTLIVAFVLTVAAILLARRTAGRPRDEAAELAREPESHRYVNGGWH